jgi:transposase
MNNRRACTPPVECPTHGVRQVALPWAEPHSRFTALFERLAVDVLAECDISGACDILRSAETRPGISWNGRWLEARPVGPAGCPA